MPAQQSLALNQPPPALVATAPPPNNYTINYNRFSEDMKKGQMVQQDQGDQEDQEG